jgi:hypothetical protein
MFHSFCLKILPLFLKQNRSSSDEKCWHGRGKVHLGQRVIPFSTARLPSIISHLRLAPALWSLDSLYSSKRLIIWWLVRCVIETTFFMTANASSSISCFSFSREGVLLVGCCDYLRWLREPSVLDAHCYLLAEDYLETYGREWASGSAKLAFFEAIKNL